MSPHLLEDTILLKEDGIFESYVDAHHLKQVVGVCIVYFVAINRDWSHTFWAWLLATYSHK